MFQKFRRRRLDAIVYIVYIQTHIYKIKCVESTFKRVATISRLYKIIDLFCKSALWKRLYSASAPPGATELHHDTQDFAVNVSEIPKA